MAAVPIAVAASANDITVIDRRGYLSDNHSAVIEPVNDPAAENPRTVTEPVVWRWYERSTINAMLAIHTPSIKRCSEVARIAKRVFAEANWEASERKSQCLALWSPPPRGIEIRPNNHAAQI